MKILIVDDSKSVQSFVRAALVGTGWELVSASNGEEGLQTFKSTSHFDLILMDWEMPVVDGPKTVNSIRSIDKDIPIIMMTTRNAIDDIQAMLDAGVNDYLMKPYTKDILVLKIQAVIDEAGARHAG